MKKFIMLILITAFLMTSLSCMAIAANAPVSPAGPAPNSGDGVPDGSGMDGAFQVGILEAPNSGDVISNNSQ